MNTTFMLYFVIPLSLGIVITLAGVIFLFVDSRRNKKTGRVDIESWLMTGGKVTSSRLSERQASDTYEPIIEYVYVVNDVEYHGNKIFPGENTGSKLSNAQEILNNHPMNTYVPVRYNPQNPAESALEAQPQRTNFITLAGWTLTGFGVCTFCFTTFMLLVVFGAAQ
jgi:Protein of unknown function (DUF3592)